MAEYGKNKRLFWFLLIIALAVLVRIYNINGALFDFNPLRQALNAFVARNFAFSPQPNFFLPQADNVGSAPGYLMFELPILPGIAAILIKLFGVHNWIFRFPSIIFFVLGAVYFYKLCLGLFDRKKAFLALCFFSFVPMSILMSRVFQVESMIVFCAVFSVYHFIRWLKKEDIASFSLYTLGLTVLVLLKFPNVYIFTVLFLLLWHYKKAKLLPWFIFSGLIVLSINAWWWIIYSGPIRDKFPTEYTLLNNEKIFGVKHIIRIMRDFTFSPGYWKQTLLQLFGIVFSPIILILALFGFLVKDDAEARTTAFYWLLATGLFFILIPDAALQNYYKIHLIPSCSIAASIGYFKLLDYFKSSRKKLTLQCCLWLMISASIFIVIFPIVRYKPVFENQALLGKAVERISRKNDLVIASFGPDAMLLFYCSRKGWSQYLVSGGDNAGLLEARRKEGACYFVCGNLDEFDYDAKFKNYLLKHYSLVGTGEREYAIPRKYSLDYLLWLALGKRKEFERVSLGYVIFDLRRKL